MKEVTSIAQHSVSQIEDLSEKYIQTAPQMSQFHFFFPSNTWELLVYPFMLRRKRGQMKFRMAHVRPLVK